MEFETIYSENEALWKVNMDGSTILEYVYGEVEDPNPSFRLVKTKAGHMITLYRPWDHPWHPGMFFSWKYINGLNFWESMYHGKKNIAVTDSFIPLEEKVGFQQNLSYITYQGETLLKEKRMIQIETGYEGYFIHWEGSFTPTNGPITLDRTENTKESPWGGYAGLSCRLNRNFLGPVITTDLGVYEAEDAFSKSFKWCDYSGKLDGFIQEHWAGICMFDHHSNVRHPSPMLTYDYKDMQFLSTGFLFNEPYVLNMGETLQLNYTFYIHDGQVQGENLKKIWEKISE
ncbi:PmoA family protein [Metabacillus halosaccharovorans]|uniref:DUF6807 domain-containing protein n=1 Tax=Metabacillus halosaccharovorans TaxID=930124 RepID=UPI00203D930B|nr:PmoA family protein [Metabacillus halosaccharovorans]MCM3439324.1 PmoA family protein [Metabacillus halosaccharovorans]